jgi:hypothetical protein
MSRGGSRVNTREKDCDTIRLGVKIRKINKDLTLKDYKKLKAATLWVSEDEYRLPLEIRADIFIGYVAATLVERDFLTGSEGQGKVAAPPVPPVSLRNRGLRPWVPTQWPRCASGWVASLPSGGNEWLFPAAASHSEVQLGEGRQECISGVFNRQFQGSPLQ